jgi:hypothetical protein
MDGTNDESVGDAMRARLGFLVFFLLVTGFGVGGCRSSVPAGGGPMDSATTAPTVFADTGHDWEDYQGSLLAWADAFATESSSGVESRDGDYPDSGNSYYRQEIEQQRNRLSALERLQPPSQLASLHRRLVNAFEDFVQADEVYRETQIAKNYLAGIKAGIVAQQRLGVVNSALLELVQALGQPDG